jgi:pyruvate dehydrogenase E2 component (dihydrolipoamide acetyltransferase)
MATFFAMPKLGMNMVEGTIVEWLVKQGDRVEAGQVVLTIETDKATQEVEAPASGVLARVLRREGETLPCNTIMAVIVEPGEAVPADIPDKIAEAVAPKSDVEVKVDKAERGASQVQEETSGRAERINISPSARKLAEELGIDITNIKSRGGRIKREDVLAAYEASQAEEGRVERGSVKPMTTTRRKIAEHMGRSARSVARVGLTLEADASSLAAWRERLEAEGTRVSYNVLLAKLVATALREFPYMNARLDGEDAILEVDEINIGVAVDAERGLLVPVLRQVDKKEVVALQEEYAALTERATLGKSTLADLEGGTFTITNLGSLEIEQFLPIINFPECAILGVGAIVKKPVVVDEQIQIRPMMALTLAFDHRLVDGAPAAKFLQRVKHLVQRGAFQNGGEPASE